MAQHYTPIWDDWFEVTQELNAQEKGRLIDAIVAYDCGGDWQEQLKGNERYVFPGYRARIDRWQITCDNRVRTKESEDDKVSQKKQSSAKIANDCKIRKTHKDNDNDNVLNKTTTARTYEESKIGPVDLDSLMLKVQQELNGLTDTHYAALNDYREQLGDDVVSFAIDLAVGNGIRNWSYVEIILRGWVKAGVHSIGEAKAENERHRSQQPQQRQPQKVLRAQDYKQRTYNNAEMEKKLGVYDLYTEEET